MKKKMLSIIKIFVFLLIASFSVVASADEIEEEEPVQQEELVIQEENQEEEETINQESVTILGEDGEQDEETEVRGMTLREILTQRLRESHAMGMDTDISEEDIENLSDEEIEAIFAEPETEELEPIQEEPEEDEPEQETENPAEETSDTISDFIEEHELGLAGTAAAISAAAAVGVFGKREEELELEEDEDISDDSDINEYEPPTYWENDEQSTWYGGINPNTNSASSISNYNIPGYANDGISSAIAKGLAKTGVEAGYDGVTCSNGGDYLSIGFSQWEGNRADRLLSWIDGGAEFMGRTFSSMSDEDVERLQALLFSKQGIEAQTKMLASDILDNYLPVLASIDGFTNKACIAYAGMWCPTSQYVVKNFISQMKAEGKDINNLFELSECFKYGYASAAGYGDSSNPIDNSVMEGYSNRADITYEYISQLG